MVEQLQFRISSELKNIIGKELITDDFIAIYELVKNSFDANAMMVEIIFNHIRTENNANPAKIFVKDNGDGMSREDLEKKWLFVGHSWKTKEDKENEKTDYRDEITRKRRFAGAKGIGRFSCDKLGSELNLYTKNENEDVIHKLIMDWDKFEEDPDIEFHEIDVNYETIDKLDIDIQIDDFKKGTILEISSLREKWNKKKLLSLKRHLQRLINPAQVKDELEFKIYLKAEDYIKEDEEKEEEYEKINGFVQNIIFEKLDIKTTHISCTIDSDGEKIYTELVDKGEFIYGVEEDNEYHPLHDVTIDLFFLNPNAKRMFTNTMGIQPVNYGSVFFYKNGIKINPYGDFGDDWLGLDKRKTQGTRRFFGNRDVMGRIEANGHYPYFKEVSSRDGGVIKTPEFEILINFFNDKARVRLEKYVIEAINWDSERTSKNPDDITADSFKIVSLLIGKSSDKVQHVEFNEKLLDIFEQKQIEKTPEIAKNLEEIKKHVKTIEDRAFIDVQVKTIRKTFRNLRKQRKTLERELEQKTMFLEQIAEKDLGEVMKMNHQIGIGTNNIRLNLINLKNKIEKGEQISNDYLIQVIDGILLQTQIISSLSKYVVNSNFDFYSQKIKGDLISYIKQYIERIYLPAMKKKLIKEEIVININKKNDIEFIRTFNPFKIIIVIDNLIDNSIKAESQKIDINLDVINGETLEIRVRDDGKGIENEYIDKIFDFGFSTVEGGTGIGLHHVKQIIEEYGSISVNNRLEKGVEFKIRVNK